MATSTRIGVVGAGAAGASVSYSLRETDAEVTVLEKSRGVCGRAATRRKNGCRYDHGANYIKSEDERVNELIREIGTDGLVDIEEDVWVFDRRGNIEKGREADENKWSYERGVTQFAKRLLACADDTDLELETRVESVSEVDEGWRITDTEGSSHGVFDAVVLTPPAPQTAEIIDEGYGDLVDEIRNVPYRTVYTGILHYPFELDLPYYALVNTDKEHEVGWVSREECKDGHVPEGESLLVVQMGPEWSRENYDEAADENLESISSMVADLLGDNRLSSPDWTDHQGWKYALPDDTHDNPSEELRRRAEEDGLFLAGDWVVGEGRVHVAARNGLEVGDRIQRRVEEGSL